MNRNRQPVNYRPLRLQATIAEGLLPVARDGGELEERTAAIFRQLAGRAGQAADREAVRRGQADAEAAALAQAPQPGEMRASVAAPDDIRAVIEGAAQRHGVDAGALLKIAEIESGFNPRAKNPNSSAGGLFQFIDGTARDYGLADRFDAGQASDAAARLLKDNAASLRKALGRDPTAGELYLAHQQGAGGAAKLLRNPNARAVDVVGRDAVRLNGGREDMSAQEFANKWIAKASGAATVSGGKPGTWRPSGSGGLYGEAYDKAGAKVYLSQLNTTMLAEMDQLAERYGDDPVALERAMGELKQAHLQDHVFPEIAADYAVAFDRQAVSYVSDARNKAEKRAREAEQAEWLGRVNGLEETRSRFLAGLDPAAEGSEARLAAMQGEIDLQYDEAVRRGLMTPADALEAKARSARDTTVSYLARQADGRTADEIAAMREEIRQDYADGALALDAEGFERIEGHLSQLERGRRARDDEARKELARRGDDMARRHASGASVQPGELSAYELSMRTAPGGAEIGQSGLRRMRVADAIRTRPIRDVEVNLAKILGDGATSEDLAFARDLIGSHRKALTDDPLGVAERFGLVAPPMPLSMAEGGTMDDAMAMVRARRDVATTAAKALGVSPRFFRPGEARELLAVVDSDPEQALTMLAGMVAAGGADLPAMLRELGPQAPVLSQAGAVLASGGNPDAALAALAGGRRGEDGRYRREVPAATLRTAQQEITAGALALHPDDARRVSAAAGNIARYRLAEAGIDPASPEAEPYVTQAMHEAAGATFADGVQFGGFAEYAPGFFWKDRKVLVPADVRADRFEDVIAALTDADLDAFGARPVDPAGRQYRAADITGAMPVVTSGGYRFAMGDPDEDPRWIRGANGQPYVLSLEAVRQLAGRVGALR